MLCMAALNVGPAFSFFFFTLRMLFIVAFVYHDFFFFRADTDPSEPLAIVMWSVRVSHHSKRPPNSFLSCIVCIIFLWFIAPSILGSR